MSVLTRRQHAEAIAAQLRGVGPQSAAQIREDLGITKREVEDALWLLQAKGQIEYLYPVQSPPIYKVCENGLR